MYRKPLKEGGYAYYNGSFIQVGDSTIINPSEQMLIDNGYEFFIPETQPRTEPSADEILQAVKDMDLPALAELADDAALDIAALYPTWFSMIGKEVAVGGRYWYDNNLYRVVQPHTVQYDWTPDKTPALWVVVSLDEWPEIPENIPSTAPWMKGDKGTWKAERYICAMDNCVWNPDQYPAGWIKQ